MNKCVHNFRQKDEYWMQCSDCEMEVPGTFYVEYLGLSKSLKGLKKERDDWKNKFKDLDKSLMAELRDPNGTIWECAEELQKKNDVLAAENARLMDDNSHLNEFGVEQTKILEKIVVALREIKNEADIGMLSFQPKRRKD